MLTLNRRDFLRAIEALAFAASPVVGGSGQVSSSATSINAAISQSLSASIISGQISSAVSDGVSAINNVSSANQADTVTQMSQSYPGTNGAEIGPSTGPAVPYIPQPAKQETELEGLVYPDDYPPDYMNFDPQTGLFDNVIIE